MSEFKTRDEFAVSMPFEAMPEMKNLDGLAAIAKIVGIDLDQEPETDEEGVLLLVTISHRWNAYNRYLYADAMIEMREKTLSNQSDTTDREGEA